MAGTDRDLELALRLAAEADRISGRAFTGEPIAFDTKSDGTPVSQADREIETRLEAMVSASRPDHGFIGEELGSSGSTTRRWIVDGIDGTANFVAGRPLWGTEIALEVDGVVVLGVSSSPGLERRWWARRGGGSWCAALAGNGATGPARRLRVSDHATVSGSRCTFMPPFEMLDDPWRALADRLTVDSSYVPPSEHGALMVADGRIELCVQPTGGPWDFAATAVIVEEAGGSFSDLRGDGNIYSGGPVLYSNSHLHESVLTRLRGL
jgi:histidinol-phosphatase